MHRWDGPLENPVDELPEFAPEERTKGWARQLLELPVLAVTAILIAFLFKTFLAQAFYIPSESMLPQLEVGDRVVVSRTAYRLHEPRRGDVVVFPEPGVEVDEPGFPMFVVHGALEATGLVQPAEEQLIKRVVALPGESVEGVGGEVLIDGEPLVEPYLPPEFVPVDFSAVRVPDGHVWVMGDNRDNSADSRVFGPVPADTLVGRAIAVAWPLGRARFL